eukprot:Tamp_15865.p1 GENE.Tamp_15865~~Tamp_15865.p1  ORF type:complete len:450 (-),score=68.40 Tamp_15865:161-1408(-)
MEREEQERPSACAQDLDAPLPAAWPHHDADAECQAVSQVGVLTAHGSLAQPLCERVKSTQSCAPEPWADTEERSLLIQSSSASVASTASVDNVGCGESTTVPESAGQHQEICHSHPDKWGTTRPRAACDRVSDESARMSFSGRFVGGDITDETFLQLVKTESANAFSGGQEKAAHEGDIDDEFFLKLLPDAGHGTLNVLNPPLQHRGFRDEHSVSRPCETVGSLVLASDSRNECDQASPAHSPHELAEIDCAAAGSSAGEADAWQVVEEVETIKSAWSQEKEAWEIKMEQMRVSLWELEQQVCQERKEKAKLVQKIEDMQAVIDQGERETKEALEMVSYLSSQASVHAAQKMAGLLQSNALELRESRRQLEEEKKRSSKMRDEKEELLRWFRRLSLQRTSSPSNVCGSPPESVTL